MLLRMTSQFAYSHLHCVHWLWLTFSAKELICIATFVMLVGGDLVLWFYLLVCVCVCVCSEKFTFTISCVLHTSVLATGILSNIGFCKQVKNCCHRFALHPITKLLFPFSPRRTQSLLATSQVDSEVCMETGNTMLQSFVSLWKKHKTQNISWRNRIKGCGLDSSDFVLGWVRTWPLLKCTSC